jgi:hypothetical protein
MIPVLLIAVSNPTSEELPLRELAESAGPAVYQCLVEANLDGPVLIDTSAKAGNLSVKPASEHEGPIEICVSSAILAAERPTLPDGSAQLSFSLQHEESVESSELPPEE